MYWQKYVLFFVDVSKSDRNLITSEKHKDIQQLRDKVNLILSVISRNHMKVVFFGRLTNLNSSCAFLLMPRIYMI